MNIKHSYYFFLAVIALTFISCNADEEEKIEKYDTVLDIFKDLSKFSSISSNYIKYNNQNNKLNFIVPYSERFNPNKINKNFPIETGFDEINIDINQKIWSDCYKTIYGSDLLDLEKKQAIEAINRMMANVNKKPPLIVETNTAKFTFYTSNSGKECEIISLYGHY